MNRRRFFIGSLILAAGSARARVGRAQETVTLLETRSRQQLEARLNVGELHARFVNVVGEAGKQAWVSPLEAALPPSEGLRVTVSLTRAQQAVGRIFNAKVDLSVPFRWSMEQDLKVLEAFREGAREAQRITLDTVNALANTATDLLVKAGFLEKAGKDLVTVTVHTRKAGQEVPDCFVYYAPYVHDTTSQRVKFDRLSSPTTDLVPPGKWWLWAEKDTPGKKVEFLCGDDGRADRTVHIPAP